MPCSAHNALEGVVWLPRLLEKARRNEAAGVSGSDHMCGYLYGDNDAVDKEVLAFLRTDDATVSALVRQQPDDFAVARTLVERGGRTMQEREAFNLSLRRKFFNFALFDADEGRMSPGLKRNLLAFVYNRLLMPIFYAQFHRAEQERARAGEG